MLLEFIDYLLWIPEADASVGHAACYDAIAEVFVLAIVIPS